MCQAQISFRPQDKSMRALSRLAKAMFLYPQSSRFHDYPPLNLRDCVRTAPHEEVNRLFRPTQSVKWFEKGIESFCISKSEISSELTPPPA
jgi:hypothetical protein